MTCTLTSSFVGKFLFLFFLSLEQPNRNFFFQASKHHRFFSQCSTMDSLISSSLGESALRARTDSLSPLSGQLRIVASSQFGHSFVGLYDMSSGSSGNVMFSSDLPMLGNIQNFKICYCIEAKSNFFVQMYVFPVNFRDWSLSWLIIVVCSDMKFLAYMIRKLVFECGFLHVVISMLVDMWLELHVNYVKTSFVDFCLIIDLLLECERISINSGSW